MQGAHTNMKPKRSACQIRGLTVSVCCLVRVENVQQEFKRFLLKTAASWDLKWCVTVAIWVTMQTYNVALEPFVGKTKITD